MKNFNGNRLLTFFTFLLLVANIVTLILLWTSKKGNDFGFGSKPKGPVFEFISKELSFTDVQNEQFKKLRETHQIQQRPIRDSIRMAKDAFFDLLKQSNVTDSLLRKYNTKVGEFTQALDLLNFKHFQQLRLICTKEQQVKFDKIINEVLIQMAVPKHGGARPGEGPEGDRPRPAHMPPGDDDRKDGPPEMHPLKDGPPPGE